MPAFDGLTYMIFGNRHWLDLMQWQGSRDFMQQKVGPSGVTGSGRIPGQRRSLPR
jgi:hypothetical protein